VETKEQEMPDTNCADLFPSLGGNSVQVQAPIVTMGFLSAAMKAPEGPVTPTKPKVKAVAPGAPVKKPKLQDGWSDGEDDWSDEDSCCSGGMCSQEMHDDMEQWSDHGESDWEDDPSYHQGTGSGTWEDEQSYHMGTGFGTYDGEVLDDWEDYDD
jgi:hypothetical protein